MHKIIQIKLNEQLWASRPRPARPGTPDRAECPKLCPQKFYRGRSLAGSIAVQARPVDRVEARLPSKRILFCKI